MGNFTHSSTFRHSHTQSSMGYLYTFYPGEPVPERKINLDFTEARDSELQWHQLDHMQVCTVHLTQDR